MPGIFVMVLVVIGAVVLVALRLKATAPRTGPEDQPLGADAERDPRPPPPQEDPGPDVPAGDPAPGSREDRARHGEA